MKTLEIKIPKSEEFSDTDQTKFDYCFSLGMEVLAKLDEDEGVIVTGFEDILYLHYFEDRILSGLGHLSHCGEKGYTTGNWTNIHYPKGTKRVVDEEKLKYAITKAK